MSRRVPRAVLAALLAPALASCTAARGGTPSSAPRQVTPPRPTATYAAPLQVRVRPDVLVVAAHPLSPGLLGRLRRVAPKGVTVFGYSHVGLGRKPLSVAVVDPSKFRAFAPSGTAEADGVWDAIARDELVLAHETAKTRHVALGSTVSLRWQASVPLRVAALATTGIPDTAALVSRRVGDALGVPYGNAALLTAGRGDPVALAGAARKVMGRGAVIHLLTQPRVPYAFLTGSAAARAFGAFSYRWYDDGTIEPDARWVRANIVTVTVPILGRVTCHRLIVPQLRRALAEVQAAGLAGLIHSYDGCYVPRFIERDPSHPISLHTWGIAIDIDAATNPRGGRGTMDARVVNAFKRWGFRWGGDWSYTDPMHFELGALMSGA